MSQQRTEPVLRRGNPDAVAGLVEQYQYRLFRYLLALTGNRQLAEDLFQETWLRVLEKGHQFDGRWKFESWLFSIARNLMIDWMRKKHPQSLDAMLEAEGGSLEAGAVQPSALDDIAEAEDRGRIAAAMSLLPPSFREVLVLRFQEDLKLEEIALIVRAPLSTVKSRLYRGLHQLRGLIEEKQP